MFEPTTIAYPALFCAQTICVEPSVVGQAAVLMMLAASFMIFSAFFK